MANITLLTSTKYNIVSITASTNTIIVSGDASAQITAGRRFRLAGTASDDGFYTVVTSVYSSPNTTIVCTEELPDDGVAVGTADLQRVLGTDADWVGGVAPGVSDVGIIPSNGNLDGSNNYGSLTCESGGTVTLDNGSNNYGSLTCESGGTVTLNNASNNNGSLTCESGGTVTLVNGSYNNVSLTCESWGTVTLDSSYNNGSLTCESGGTVTLDSSNNNGSLTCESGGTVTLVNGSYNNVSLTCESGGTVTLDSSNNFGSLTCESGGTGGTVTLVNNSGNYGSLTCESGGTVTLDGSGNYGSLTCESGGTVTLNNGSYNYFSLTCESGGTVTLDNGSYNTGSLTCFLYGTVTGATPLQLTIEKRTLHYTAGQSTDTLPVGQGGTITLRNSTTVLDVVSPTPGSAATTWESGRNSDPGVTHVLAGNNYSIAGVGKTASLTLANTQYVLSTAPDYGVGGTGGAKTATFPAGANVQAEAAAFGINGSSETPSYPTTATSQAAQHTTDADEVTAKQQYIYPNANLLGKNDGTLRASNIGSLAGTTNLIASMLSTGVTIDNVVGNSSDTTSDNLTVASLARQGAPPGPGLGID